MSDDLLGTLAIVALVGIAVLGSITWVNAKVASIVFGNGKFDAGMETSFLAFTRLKGHLTDPAAAWPTEQQATLPGAVGYWLVTVFLLAAVGAIGWYGWRIFRGELRDLERRRRLGVQAQPRMAGRADLRNLYVRELPADRFLLGRHGRRLVAAESVRSARGREAARNARGPVALIGPSRSGKSTAAVAGILGWTGPAILVSVKADLLHDTEQYRRELGDVQVFDPPVSPAASPAR